jgi:RND family efflux transporter MFP subunit
VTSARKVQGIGLALLLGAALAAAPVRDLLRGPREARAAEPEGEKPRTKVQVVRPRRDTVHRVLRIAGDLKPWREARIYARASGPVLPDPVEVGTRVDPLGTEGPAVLARLATPDLDAAVASAQARVERAQASLEEARSDLAQVRAEGLAVQARLRQARGGVESAKATEAKARADAEYRKVVRDRVVAVRERSPDLVAQDAADEARGALAMAEAQVVAARAEVSSAQDAVAVAEAEVAAADARSAASQAALGAAEKEEALARAVLGETQAAQGFATIRAPFAGVVAERLVDTGDLVRDAARNSAATPLFRLVDDRKLRVRFYVPDTDAPSCLCGNEVTFETDSIPDREFAAKVMRVAEALDPATRTMEVEAELDNPTDESGRRLLKTDMFARVRVALESYPDSLVLPARAVTTQKRKSAVLVVRDGVVAKVGVRIGVDDGRRIQILEGLAETDLVVYRGGQQVAAGERVEVEVVEARE